MVLVSRSIATLRISGDDLDPEEISKALNGTPTFSTPKNGFHAYPPGRGRIARTGIWRIRTDYAHPADLDGQVRQILAPLTDDMSVWTDLSKRYAMDIFCGLWLRESNEMMGVLPETLKALGDRHVQLELDIYHEPDGVDDDEQTDHPVTK